MSPPADIIPNFHDPANLDAYVTLTIALCVAFGTLAVLLRMYTKVFILRVLAWEDCKFYQLNLHRCSRYRLMLLDVIVLAWVNLIV